MKKIICFFLCFMVIFSACSITLFSSAIDTVSLPFPNPLLFEGLPSIVLERNNNQYYMIVLYFPEMVISDYLGNNDGSYVYNSTSCWFQFNLGTHKLRANVGVEQTFAHSALNATPILYVWYEGSSSMRVYNLNNFICDGSFRDLWDFGSGNTITNVYSFNSNLAVSSSDPLASHSKNFVFNGDLNGQQLNDYLLSVDNSLKTVVSSINYANNTLDSLLEQYIGMNRRLSAIQEYVSILVDSMTESHSAPPVTTNPSVSDYNDIENEVGSDAYNSLDNFNVPDFSGGLGFGVANALSFISTTIEDFTGNGELSDSHTKKIASVVFIVLMLGLVTLILAMNRRSD